jgi:neutral ceramidase
VTTADSPWLAGVGIADVTGEPWGIGMMGYGMRFQRTVGIHLRQRSRAFVFVDRASGRRLVYVVADVGMFFRNVTDAVLARLDPSLYDETNVVLTATHTHAGVGGYSCDRLYNMTTGGFRPHTFDALVDGVVASIEQAHADLAPARLVLSRGQLRDASVNRSPQAFARDPDHDRATFPDGVDPATTLLRVERDGQLVGAIHWFATHGTSLSNRNMLISGDNKGYAAYRWEREVNGVDYLAQPHVVTAFAQTNAGDMSPNVPDATCGPTDDQFENTRIIGRRQADSAQELAASAGDGVDGGLDTALRYVHLPQLDVSGQWTPDGRPHRTGRAVLGAAFAAGTKEGPGAPFCHEGVDDNPALYAASNALFRVRPDLGDAQWPKTMLIPCGALGWTAETLPVQLVRLGPLVVLTLAHEVTIVAGLRLRRAVALALDVPVDSVLVQGYANDYAGYLTTPEEYAEQRYEGGHTMFGRWQLPAYLQEVTAVALQLRDDAQPRRVTGAPRPRVAAARPGRPVRMSVSRATLAAPRPEYLPGDVVRATVHCDDPRGPVRTLYFSVERAVDKGWKRIADDGDWSTTVTWHHDGASWAAELAWHVPADATGTFRLRYLDETTSTFTVKAARAPRAATSARAKGRSTARRSRSEA